MVVVPLLALALTSPLDPPLSNVQLSVDRCPAVHGNSTARPLTWVHGVHTAGEPSPVRNVPAQT